MDDSTSLCEVVWEGHLHEHHITTANRKDSNSSHDFRLVVGAVIFIKKGGGECVVLPIKFLLILRQTSLPINREIENIVEMQ